MSKKYSFCLTIPQNRGDYVIFSLPQTNQYQKISNLTTQPFSYKFVKDKKWGNEVAVFTLNDVRNTVSISFYLQPKPFSGKINPKFSLSNYQNPPRMADRFIDGKDKKIKKLVQEVVKKEKNLPKIIDALYQFTLNYLRYGQPIEGLYPYKQALEEKVTDCGGFSTFLASLLQSLNIPTRLIVGFLIKENLLTKLFSRFEFCDLSFEFLLMHAWLEVLLPDKTWFPLDPSIEWRRRHGLTKRDGGLGHIPADRLVVSYGEDFKILINNKAYEIDLLQKPIYL